MIRGLYTAATGMLNNQKKMDVVANNLANVSTTGFKKDISVSQSFPEMLTKRINDMKPGEPSSPDIGHMSLGTDVVQIHTAYLQGTMTQTGSNTDMGIANSTNAFFTVQVPGENGGQMYTRNGSWLLDREGYLTTNDGYRVLGQGGEIQVGTEQFVVSEQGGIYVDGQLVDNLQIVEFTDTSNLQKYGDNLVRAGAGTQTREFSGSVAQGFLESSNVSTVEEMVSMISIMRNYEANQKVIKAYDDTLEKAINEVGRA